MSRRAIILLSGGLDSATALSIAQADGYECFTLSFDYGQRARVELEGAAKLAESAGATHKVISLDLGNIGGSALTDMSIDVPTEETTGIPVTYVPARNTVFLSLALGYAEVVQAEAIYIGVNAVDYSGYPDCRPAFIEAFQALAHVATKDGVEGRGVQIKTPLMDLTKADIIRKGLSLGVDYSLTVSCYTAAVGGVACGQCDSCRLRLAGFADCGVEDPVEYAAH